MILKLYLSLIRITPVSCMATMKHMTPAEHKIAREDYWAKQDRLKRPLSPHLTIYKFPVIHMS